MKFIVSLLLASCFLTINGYSQEKLFTVKNSIGLGKEIYHVKDKKSDIRQGEYLYKYLNKVQIKGQYLDNLKQGNWLYTIGENFTISAFYDKGEKDSTWTYSEGNRLISEINFKDGKREGKSIGYNKQGKILSIVPYQNGKMNGTRQSFYDNGKIKFEVEYKNDTLDGNIKYYNISGKVNLHVIYRKSIPYSIEVLNMPDSLKFFSGTLKNGTGSFSVYTKDVKNDSITLLSRQEYINGMLDGKCTVYRYDGRIKFTGNYMHNFMVGSWHFHNPVNPQIYTTKTYYFSDSTLVDSTDTYVVTPYKTTSIGKQEMPKFCTNGNNGFREYVSAIMQYPASALEKKIKGQVLVQFDVDLTGAIINVKAINKANADLINEAERVVKLSPNWIPGFEDNIPCFVRYTFPITFGLR
jgi:antitoxin component YwqK of YwqJK toxin-antitoxin module